MDKSCMAGWVTFSAYTAREVDNISHKSSDFNRFVAVEMIKFSKSKIYLEKSFIITSTQVFSSTLHGLSKDFYLDFHESYLMGINNNRAGITTRFKS